MFNCMHAFKLTVPALVYSLFALKKARAVGRNVVDLICSLKLVIQEALS